MLRGDRPVLLASLETRTEAADARSVDAEETAVAGPREATPPSEPVAAAEGLEEATPSLSVRTLHHTTGRREAERPQSPSRTTPGHSSSLT